MTLTRRDRVRLCEICGAQIMRRPDRYRFCSTICGYKGRFSPGGRSYTNFRGTLADRLKARIAFPFDGSEDCWPWTGLLNTAGYGVIATPRSNGVHTGPKMVPAHRVAYELWCGPIPTGLTIDHLCRNRWCVNPCHLEPVTRGENVRRGVISRRLEQATA